MISRALSELMNAARRLGRSTPPSYCCCRLFLFSPFFFSSLRSRKLAVDALAVVERKATSKDKAENRDQPIKKKLLRKLLLGRAGKLTA